MSPPINPSSLKVTVDNLPLEANVDTIKSIKAMAGYSKMLEKAPKATQVFLNSLNKTANMFTSFETALNTYKTDSLEGKDVSKYTTVIFNNKAIVCKTKIKSLFLRILGGKISQVGTEMDKYLDSKAYTGTRLNLAKSILKEKGREDMQTFENAIHGLISDYHVINPNDRISADHKNELINMINTLIEKNNGTRTDKISEAIKKEIIEFIKDTGTEIEVEDYKTEVYTKDINLDIDELLGSINTKPVFDETFEKELSRLLNISTFNQDKEYFKKLNTLITKYEDNVDAGDIPDKIKTAIKNFLDI